MNERRIVPSDPPEPAPLWVEALSLVVLIGLGISILVVIAEIVMKLGLSEVSP